MLGQTRLNNNNWMSLYGVGRREIGHENKRMRYLTAKTGRGGAQQKIETPS